MLCDRRGFLRSSAGGAALAFAGGLCSTALAESGDVIPPPCLDRTGVPPRNRRPYSGIDWAKAIQINGTTHMHQERDLLEAVRKRRIGFLTVSNYYPSKPMYPWREAVNEHIRAVADWPVVVNGKYTEGPFDWNKIIAKWSSELSEKDRKLLPLPTRKLRSTFTWNVPMTKGRRIGPQVEVFARVKACAADGCGETLFSQPFMLV